MRRRLSAGLAAWAGCLVLAGCASSIAGKATPQGAAAPTGGGATSTSGGPTASGTVPTTGSSGSTAPTTTGGQSSDFRTVDPCSFFAKDAFDGLGKNVTASVLTADYSTCSLNVQVTGASPRDLSDWTVALDMGSSFTSTGQYTSRYSIPVQETQVQGTTTYAGSGGSVGCLRAFNLADGTTVVITAKPVNSATKGDPCQAGDDGLNSALTAFKAGRLARLNLPANSPANINACSAFVASAAKLVSAQPNPSGEHGCQWSSAQVAVTVTVESNSWPPLVLPGASPKSFTLSGHAVSYTDASMGGRSLVDGYLDLGTSPVGEQGNHDVVHALLVQFSGGAPGQQELTTFFTAALPNLPKR